MARDRHVGVAGDRQQQVGAVAVGDVQQQDRVGARLPEKSPVPRSASCSLVRSSRPSDPTSRYVVPLVSSGRAPSGSASTLSMFDQAQMGTRMRKSSHTSSSARMPRIHQLAAAAGRAGLLRRGRWLGCLPGRGPRRRRLVRVGGGRGARALVRTARRRCVVRAPERLRPLLGRNLRSLAWSPVSRRPGQDRPVRHPSSGCARRGRPSAGTSSGWPPGLRLRAEEGVAVTRPCPSTASRTPGRPGVLLLPWRSRLPGDDVAAAAAAHGRPGWLRGPSVSALRQRRVPAWTASRRLFKSAGWLSSRPRRLRRSWAAIGAA